MAVRGREEMGERAARRVRAVAMVGPLRRLLAEIHGAGAERDRAGNRRFFYDHYLSLLLLYFANPALESLRALQAASGWDAVRKAMKIPRVSLGSLSESVRVFDPALVRPILGELGALARPLMKGRDAEALAGLTAVDGTIFSAASRMAWALWQDAEHRGVKLHLQFSVTRCVPVDARLTPAACSEPDTLDEMLQAGRLYVLDRGYASFSLMKRIIDAGSSFVTRVKDDIALHIEEEQPLSESARAAGVIRDVRLSRLGTAHHKDVVGRPMRLVIVQTQDRSGQPTELWLVTDRLDLEADLVAAAYRYRWTIELFFRWLKSVLGARHLLSQKSGGVELQMYAALIVCLLIVIRTGAKPNRRTWEAIQFYLLGWVSSEELQSHLSRLKKL